MTAPLLGSELPRLFTPPARELTPQTTRGFEAIAFATEVLGIDLMPWQRWLLVHLLELTEQGVLRFRVALTLCARQQGKSTVMAGPRPMAPVRRPGRLVIGTAQTLSMAEESWEGAVSMAEGVPDLVAEVAHVSRVNGDKHLRLTSGERYKVAAASRRGGRGLSSDLVLLDELREHQSWDAWGAVTKTTMASPSPQTLGFSNAGDAQSVVLATLRDKALSTAADRITTLGLFEWSAPEGCALNDRDAWAAANPALGHRTPEQAIVSALERDPDDVFRTEVLCQFVTTVNAASPPLVWESLADPAAARGASPVFALDVAPTQSTATIAVSWQRRTARRRSCSPRTATGSTGSFPPPARHRPAGAGGSSSRPPAPPGSSCPRSSRPASRSTR